MKTSELADALHELLPDECVPVLVQNHPSQQASPEAELPGGEQLLRAVARNCPRFGWDYLDLTPDTPYARLARGPSGVLAGYFFLPIFPHSIPDSKLAYSFIESAFLALKQLAESEATHIVFDLRGHPGGLLYIFMMIAGFFVDRRKPLVYPTSHGSRAVRFEDGQFLMIDIPKVIKNSLRHAGELAGMDKTVRVLVDEKTASCGELIALVLRDVLVDCEIVGKPSQGALTMFAQVRVGPYVVSVPHAVMLDRVTLRPLLGLTPDKAELEPELRFVLPYG